jgi:hypothetical protein
MIPSTRIACAGRLKQNIAVVSTGLRNRRRRNTCFLSSTRRDHVTFTSPGAHTLYYSQHGNSRHLLDKRRIPRAFLDGHLRLTAAHDLPFANSATRKLPILPLPWLQQLLLLNPEIVRSRLFTEFQAGVTMPLFDRSGVCDYHDFTISTGTGHYFVNDLPDNGIGHLEEFTLRR